MRLILKFYLLPVLLIAFYQSKAQQILLDSAFNKLYLAKVAMVSSNTMSIADLKSKQKFKSHNDFAFHYGLHKNSQWINFDIHNESSKRRALYLEITNPNLYHARLYGSDGDQILLLHEFGSKFSFYERPIFHPNFILPIYVDSGANNSLYLEILPGMLSNNFSLILWDANAREEYRHKEFMFLIVFQIIHFIFLGVLAVVMYITRQRWQWTLLIYSLLGVIYKYIDIGLGYKYIWSDYPEIQQIAPFIITNILSIAAIFFLRRYLNTKFNSPCIDRCYVYFSLLLSVIVLIRILNVFLNSILLSYIHYINAVVILLVILFTVYNLIFFIKVGLVRSACIAFTICFGPLMIVYIIFCLKLLAIYHVNIMALSGCLIFLVSLDADNLFVWAVLWEILFVSVLMVFRLNSLFNDNQRMYEVLEIERKESIKQLMISIENERRRVAYELHDGSGVSLSAIRMKLTHLKELIADKVNGEKLNSIMHDIDQLSKEIREISHFIMPISLSKLGLKAGINELISKLNQLNTEIGFNLFQQYDEGKLGKNHQINIYRICQELINNAIKHSNASQVTLNLIEDDNVLSISMEDDGVGFDIYVAKKGLGMNNIYLRAELMQGTFQIESNMLSGSFFHIRIPIK